MSDIDEVKSRIDIVEFIQSRVGLKKAGRNFKGLCPFHGEKTPSFMVSPDRQSWHCFGCGKGGSVMDFVMEYDHVDFREALEDLAEIAGVTLSKTSKGSLPEDSLKETLKEIHHLAAEYYHYLLTTHKVGVHARKYLTERGVSEKIITTFGLGYSANSWEGVVSYLKKKGYAPEILEQSGLLIASQRGGYDRFRGRIMFPLRDQRGQVIAFAGRLLDKEVKEAKYINSPETPLYIKGNTVFALDVTKKAIQQSQTVVLMEGEFDVISSFQAGITNCVAIKGTALTESQVHLLKRYAKKIVFALDSDVAGDKAANRGLGIAEKVGMELYVARLPQGKDPDDIARESPHLLKQAIEQALSLYDYYVAVAKQTYPLDTAYGKKGFTEMVLPMLSEIENSVIQSHYLKQIAETLGVSETSLVTMMKKFDKQRKSPISQPLDGEKIEQEDRLEVLLLALLLQKDRQVVMDFDSNQIDFHSIVIGKLIRQLQELLNQFPEQSLSDSINRVPKEYGSIIDQALLRDLTDIIDNDAAYRHTWDQTVKELKKRDLKEQLKLVTSQSETGDQALLSQQLKEISAKLRILDK